MLGCGFSSERGWYDHGRYWHDTVWNSTRHRHFVLGVCDSDHSDSVCWLKGDGMASVYLVTAGEYSDYHIIGAFSTEELAEKWIERYDESAGIEEYEVDELQPTLRPEYAPYHVEILMETADVVKVEKKEDSYAGTDVETSSWLIGKHNQFKRLTVECWAKSEEHAAKIAMEQRSIRLANEKG